jgi:hypothetical protein
VSIFDRIVEYSNISKPSERVPKEDGGMLVEPSDDGSRPGYAKSKILDRISFTPEQVKKINSDLPTGIKLTKEIRQGQPYYYWRLNKTYKSNKIEKIKAVTNKNYLKDVSLNSLKENLNSFIKTNLPNALTKPEYEKLRYAEENINLGQEEFAKKLNDRGFTTIQGDSFTRSNVNNIDNEIGIRKIQSYTLKQQKDFLKNTLRGGEELRDINKLSISAQEKESIIRKLANAIRSQDTRNSELGSFAHTDSREAKLWKNFFRASQGDRFEMGGVFEGKDLSQRKNWPRDANGNVNWGKKGPDGKPAWKSVVFTDKQTPKGEVNFTFDNLKTQVDDAFGSGTFQRSTTAYATQKEAYKNFEGRKLAEDSIKAEYYKKYKKYPSEGYIEQRIKTYAPGQVHHWGEGGVKGDPYKVQFVSKSANQALGKAEMTYNANLKRAGNDPVKIEQAKNLFKNQIKNISTEMGGIKYIFEGKQFGSAATPESVYTFERSKVENDLLKLAGQIDPDCAQAVANGGRIGLKSIGSTNVCLTKAKNYLSQELVNGIGTQQNAKTSLIKRILAGSANFLKQSLSPKELLKMENLIGKPALYATAAFDTAMVADDVLRKGLPLNVAAAKTLTGSLLNLDENAARAKNLLESNVPLSPAAKEYAQSFLDYDQYQKLNLSFPSSLIASKMPGSEKYFQMQENLKNKINNTPETGAMDYQTALDEFEGGFKAKAKLFDAPDAPEITPLTNKFALPASAGLGRTGPMTAKQNLQIDLSPITYQNFKPIIESKEKVDAELRATGAIPEDSELLPEIYQQYVVKPSEFEQLMKLPSFRGASEKFASGGLASLTKTIPPESGPQSEGLLSLKNRVINS